MVRALICGLVAFSLCGCSRGDAPPGAPGSGSGAGEPRKRPEIPAIARDATAGQRAFALALLAEHRKAKKPGDNAFLSPFSIAAALSMTAAGARGETRADFDRVVRLLPGDAAHEAYAALHGQILAEPATGAELRVANRIYAEQSFALTPDIVSVTRDRYRASLERVDFKHAPEPVRIAINDWVAGQTNDRIKDLVPMDAVGPDTRMVLVNAIYFLGKWRERFDEARTTDGPFHALGGDVTAKLMHAKIHNAELFEDADSQWVRLRYQNSDTAMLIALPRTHDGLAPLLAKLDPAALDRVRGALQPTEVLVTLPRFRVEDGALLAGALHALGMGHTFCDTAPVDLSGIGGVPGELCVSHVIHKAFVQADEAGTEAAAATAVVVITTETAAPRTAPQFVADHPFLFIIEDVPSGAPLFIGTLEKP